MQQIGKTKNMDFFFKNTRHYRKLSKIIEILLGAQRAPSIPSVKYVSTQVHLTPRPVRSSHTYRLWE